MKGRGVISFNNMKSSGDKNAIMFSMAYYINALKRHAIDPSFTDEEFVRCLFAPYILAGNVKDRNKEQLDLNKSRVSTLLSQKDDVPIAMRNALSTYGIIERMKPGYAEFVEDTLVREQLPALVRHISDVINSTPTISAEIKQRLTAIENNAVEYLCATFLEAIRQDNRAMPPTDNYLWHHGTNTLQLIAGDIFKFGFGNRKKQLAIVVIPVNTSFDTHISWLAEGVDNPIVSPTTLHGQWLDRWTKTGNTIDQLNRQIENNLAKQNLVFTVDRSGRKHYAIGTIAAITGNNAIYYLLAISAFDDQNIAHSTADNIRAAVLSLLEFYNRFGNGYPMYLPLFGTGRSRAALDYQEAFDLIRGEMMCNKQLIQGKITIVASKEAMAEIRAEVE